jgi:transcriptional regulator with PAS, ATPase and Fis domain
VRIIAATNRSLEDLMRQGRFREDLFYRLNVIAIEVPPLRQRKEDIYPLAIHFLNKYARSAGKTIQSIDTEVVDRLKRYPWPGNVRELENLIERAVVLADGPVLKVEDFPQEIEDYEEVLEPSRDGALNDRLEAMERESLRKALREANGNKSRAARQLGLARSTFISKLKKWDLS